MLSDKTVSLVGWILSVGEASRWGSKSNSMESIPRASNLGHVFISLSLGAVSVSQLNSDSGVEESKAMYLSPPSL